MPITNPLLSLRELKYGWRPDAPPVLDIPEFDLAHGEKIFITGPSGSGKSTLLGIIAGVLTPQRGALRILEQNITRLSAAGRDRFRADHIGFVFQLFNLIPYLSVRDNVTLPCHFAAGRRARIAGIGSTPEREALRLLNDLGLSDPALLARPVTELSVGQQQRVATARALIGSPPLLIADEPTSALDATHRQRFLELLFHECAVQGTSLLFVSHDESLSPAFDRRLHMNEINRVASRP
ncbi:MAG: ABC transporter ATP-binding protein [Gammaproteobacteria bacterium]|nr:ABC transporter ATP-binding protein [Gammaproteobacteria bacterium]MCP5137161.1 ABC transporter ATP-binding protein [Gammaproteobacteria bacterium]